MSDLFGFEDGAFTVFLGRALERSRSQTAHLNTIDENGNVIHEATPTPADAPGGMFAVGQVAPSTTETIDEGR